MKRDHSSSMGDDIQSSYKRICDIKREEIDYNKRIGRIDDQIEKLEQERLKYLGEKRTLLATKLEDAIIPYSKSWTLQFASKMRSLLPRELRDMVYQEFADDPIFMRPLRLATVLDRQGCHGPDCQCHRDTVVPHAMDPAYVGPEIASELVETLYKEHPDLFFTVDRVERIKTVLLEDRFHVGFKPIHVAREITINWKLSRSISEETKRMAHKRRPTKKDFSPLLKVRDKAGFHLRIIMSQRHINFIPLEKALAMIKPVYQQFNAQGANVEIIFLYDVPNSFRYSLHDALTQPPTEWKERFAKHIDDKEQVYEHHKEYLDEMTHHHDAGETSSENSDTYDDTENDDEMDMHYGGFPYFDDEDFDFDDDMYGMGMY